MLLVVMPLTLACWTVFYVPIVYFGWIGRALIGSVALLYKVAMEPGLAPLGRIETKIVGLWFAGLLTIMAAMDNG